ncbi:MAG: FtsX-like permease family protein [Desulfobacteraceae bacterium]|jgi:ABC-type lipoprotein release transport system permease subunit
MYFILSWRNLWRNKKRTVIAAASVFFAVLLAVVMRSGQKGSYSYMIDSSAKLFTGYLQVQGKGYWDNRSLDRSIILNADQQKNISEIPHVTAVTPRLEAYSLVAYETSTKVAQVTGIDPSLEDRLTGLKKRLSKGSYLSRGSDGVLIAQGLADLLKISVGDDLIIYGQGYHGQIAAARLPVSGIVDLPFPELNNSMVYLTLSQAREVFSAYKRITSLAVIVDNVRNLSSVVTSVRRITGEESAIMTWDEMLPDLVQNIQLDNASGIIMIIILYIVITFGVFGTVMMMTSERLKEFGILISVGMKKSRLIIVTMVESIFISILGVVAGILGSIPIIFYLHYNPIRMTGDAAKAFESIGVEPIMNFSTDPQILLSQSVVVLIIALATSIYPVLFIRRIQPAKAVHG